MVLLFFRVGLGFNFVFAPLARVGCDLAAVAFSLKLALARSDGAVRAARRASAECTSVLMMRRTLQIRSRVERLRLHGPQAQHRRVPRCVGRCPLAGCSLMLLMLLAVADLEDCCHEHDFCYANCAKTRAKCDKKFGKCLRRTCKKTYSGEQVRVVCTELLARRGGSSCAAASCCALCWLFRQALARCLSSTGVSALLC